MRGSVSPSRSRNAGVLAISFDVDPAHSIVWGRIYFKKAELLHLPSSIILLSEWPPWIANAMAAPERMDLVPSSSGLTPYLLSPSPKRHVLLRRLLTSVAVTSLIVP